MTDTREPADFAAHYPHLLSLAYRMLGSVSEAEDAVQEAWLRWEAAHGEVRSVRAFLSTVVTRLCLDRLKSARHTRERYVGEWLPEPWVAPTAAPELAHDVSVALMLALERLSPLERAAFLLHDVFEVGFPEIAIILGRSEAACRQLAARARAHVRSSRRRFVVPDEQQQRVAAAFFAAARTGDVEGLGRLLADGVVLHSDGGGRRTCAINPILGRDRVTRFFVGLARKHGPDRFAWSQHLTLNGLPGMLMLDSDGLLQTTTVQLGADGIEAIYLTRNPDKLAHLAGVTPGEG